jgi:hypothetical protein
MERDEESGLDYHGARFRIPWLGRWIGCDPIPVVNRFVYARDNPITYYDPDGAAPRCAGREGCAFDSSSTDDSNREWEAMSARFGPDWYVLDSDEKTQYRKEVQDQIAEENYAQNAEPTLKDRATGRVADAFAYLANTRAGKVIGGAWNWVGEQVDVVTKTFDRAAAGSFYGMSGAASRPPDPVGVSATISHETFNKAQDIAGPSIRRGISASLEAASTPGAIRDAAALGVGLVEGVSKVPFWLSEFSRFSRNESTYRKQVARLIRSWLGEHPLNFLVTKQGNLKMVRGTPTLDYLKAHPELIQAGHVFSKSKEPGHPIVVMTAFVNQSLARAEKVGGWINLEYALNIGGVLVEHTSANEWVKRGWLAQSDVDKAERVFF